MAESQNEFDMAEYKNSLDSMLAVVQPDTWLGHARLAIAERDFSENEKNKILRGTQKLLNRRDDLTARLAAKACMDAVEGDD